MRILIDIGHPAHVHFFRNPIRLLTQNGHEVFVTSRKKEMAVDLLDGLQIRHQVISVLGGGGLPSLGMELIKRNLALLRVVRSFRPDVMAAIGGISIAHVGLVMRLPSLVFYDTENARLQNAITYPFASRVIVPRCYESWVPRNRAVHYRGYHELSYLHPRYFMPNKEIAIANGLDPDRDTFFIRLVSWQANHDVGERGWTTMLLRDVVSSLSRRGKVLISSEAPLPPEFSPYRYTGDINAVHHVLAHCRLFIGESATMASECAVLGVPAIYAANTGRGYTNEQAARYGLVTNIRQLTWTIIDTTIERVLSTPASDWSVARTRLLGDTIDVAAFAAECIERYPALPPT